MIYFTTGQKGKHTISRLLCSTSEMRTFKYLLVDKINSVDLSMTYFTLHAKNKAGVSRPDQFINM